MQRKIKFRVWDKSLGKFVNFNQLAHFFEDKSLVFQQFIGICDEEVKDVYEGDIVSWHEYQGWEDGRTFTGYYEVRWNEDYLRWDFYDPWQNDSLEAGNIKFDEVVGNIMENPELCE